MKKISIQIFVVLKKGFSRFSPAYIFFFFIALLLFFYSEINKVYYQQDEWYTFGKTIYYGYANPSSIFTQMYSIHYVPLANLYYIVEYFLFGISSQLYMYEGLI